MASDPPEAENLAYWLRRLEALRRQARFAEAERQRIPQLEAIKAEQDATWGWHQLDLDTALAKTSHVEGGLDNERHTPG